MVTPCLSQGYEVITECCLHVISKYDYTNKLVDNYNHSTSRDLTDLECPLCHKPSVKLHALQNFVGDKNAQKFNESVPTCAKCRHSIGTDRQVVCNATKQKYHEICHNGICEPCKSQPKRPRCEMCKMEETEAKIAFECGKFYCTDCYRKWIKREDIVEGIKREEREIRAPCGNCKNHSERIGTASIIKR